MGLAASQARFLCITARKANCEYKSTDLAQQKLEITNQLADISNTYSNAMNATTLMWDNENCSKATAINYGLLMSPSVANDYNPYMLTTNSGAIVLNPEFAAAAKAAGISKSGGFGSQESRDKFISALAYNGRITEETAKTITRNFFNVDEEATAATGEVVFGQPISTNGINWNPLTGMGAPAKDKYSADDFTLSQLCLSDIGKTQIDWAQVLVGSIKDTNGNYITEQEYEQEIDRFTELSKSVQRREITPEVIAQLTKDYHNYEKNKDEAGYSAAVAEKYQAMIAVAQNINSVDDEGYIVNNGQRVQYDGKDVLQKDAYSLISAQLTGDKEAFQLKYPAESRISLDKGLNANGKPNTTDYNLVFNLKDKDISAEKTLSVLANGIVLTGDAIEKVDIADVLTGNITIISGKNTKQKDFIENITSIFDRIVNTLGYSDASLVTGTGLNVDNDSAKALSFAYNMIMKQYLSPTKIVSVGNDSSQTSMLDNAAYTNAESYNAIGTNKSKTNYAVSLSNMLSAFLTYYDNGLRGVDSPYVVGASTDTSEYVTQDASYVYLGKLEEETYSMSEKVADFYDILYNNIIENGWREDNAINDSEYMEQCIKNGTYSMSSLNGLDGYYYQTRYNDTGYMVEVADADAIARAEAEFTAKKAELTYKEDKIDMQTKQLDAEISALTTEYDTVKNLITKSIEKTFAMFSN